MACRKVSRPSGVRTISTCGAPAAAFRPSPPGPFPPSPRAPRAAARALSSTFTGVSSAASTFLAGQRREHRLVEPGLSRAARDIRAAALSTQPAETGTPSSMPITLRGPLRRHVPVAGQQHRGGVQHRPVGHRARVQRRAAAPRTSPSRSTGTPAPAAPTRSPSGRSPRR